MLKRHPISHSLTRQLFILGCIFSLGYFVLRELAPFLSGVFGAIIMFVLTKGWMDKLTKAGWKRWISATVLIIFTIVVVLLPIAGIILLLTNRVKDVITNFSKYKLMLQSSLNSLETSIGVDITSRIKEFNPSEFITKFVQGATNNTLDLTVIAGLFFFILYYMLINYDVIKKSVRDYIPMNNKNFNRVSHEIVEMTKSNAIAIPMVAFCQGVVALVGFLIFDVQDPFFWFAVTTVGSLIPFVGTAIGFIPVVAIVYYQGDTTTAIWLALYGMIVVASTDNIFRIFVQKSLAEIHPLITLVGIIVGLPIFGFLGLVFGPLLVSLFLLFLRIYKEEYFPKKFGFWK
ncbi:AI-2E family transporter [Weeksellaceae bacterium TAE3-ERU29]|nr:AI-2E family transporter [Weeksellaceae bacterium TAE3-ERU29]